MLLLKYWRGENFDVTQAQSSSPTVEGALMELNEFFSLAKERDFKVTRVHTHPHGSFLLCYDKNKWEDGFESIVKSSMNVPEFCI